MYTFKFIRKCHSGCFITTPIFYVNASPHIGHLYSVVLADAAHRFHQLKYPNEKTIFSTGTDEHGLKIQQAATAANFRDIKFYCDQVSSKYRELFNLYDIQYTRFVRTTDKDHIEAVQNFWNILESKEYIYLSKYSGWYSVPDETFFPEYQVIKSTDKNGNEIKISEVSGHIVEWTDEENYMFKLSSLKSDLLYWIKDKNRIEPSNFYNIIEGWIHSDQGMLDISISRPAARNPWGIPVPSCSSQIIYVWLDALVNYLTVAGYPNLTLWPPSLHVLGKDILKFHCLYWPAFLIAAGLEPPSKLFIHSHWTVDNIKMSKSKNNVVDPFEKMKLYTASGFRYFLLKEGVPYTDGNYTETKVVNLLNSDLANTLGNLLSRCVGKTVNIKQIYPSFNKNEFNKLFIEYETLKVLSEQLSGLEDILNQHYGNLRFYSGIHAVVEILYNCNKFFNECKPWDLRKHEADLSKLMCVLHVTLETLRICSIGLLPIVPYLSNLVFRKLNIRPERTTWSSIKPTWICNKFPNEDVPLNGEKIIVYPKLKT